MATLAGTALALAKRGHAVFPCKPRRKEPITKRGVLDATTEIEIVTAWWSGPDLEYQLNIGMATGAVSGVFVVDVDGQEGEASLQALQAEHGPLPPSVTSYTGKGRHIFFRMPAQPVANSVGRLGANIDVRGDGGYVITPPSIHPNGSIYTWGTVRVFAEAPRWLLELIAADHHHNGRGLEHWHDVLTTEIPEGERNATLASIAGKLLHIGADLVFARDMVLAVNIARCSPPLSSDEINDIVISVDRTASRRRP